ncbi:hypothetical protein BST81_19465 [Leptolyngbya sp. 'hensonii']|uniref:hypothetical protein n=1 Tax=Leptolyngbya sp. 'hensonii' TaxID=1922337 RepID=UPI00094F751D|nr:hypothetical protein [Leptolyngbya sp. 'hensonii']OLP16873.1 hypothetical protein BST81_19465 [Leptolyngbya sp. 'hensonii']
MVRAILAVILAGFMTACSTIGGPSRQLVKQALVLHLTQIQQEISQQLRMPPASFEINQVRVNRQQSLQIEDLPAFHIQGTYNLSMDRHEGSLSQQQNPFELYLQRQRDGKTWRWARPTRTAAGESIWAIQPLNPSLN